MSKEKWKVKIKFDDGVEILLPHRFENIFAAGMYADYETEKYQKALGQKVTEIMAEVE